MTLHPFRSSLQYIVGTGQFSMFVFALPE